jgi:hypothetical protein
VSLATSPASLEERANTGVDCKQPIERDGISQMTSLRTSRRPAKSILCTVALGAALAASAPAAQAQATAAGVSKCAVLTSLPWSFKAPGGTLSGTRYTVATQGFGCALARKLVPGLIRQKGTPLGRSLNGPAGYTCIADIGGNNPNAIAGVCHRSGGRFFAWGPKVK